MITLPEYDESVQSDNKNSSTLKFSCALCADCDRWYPTRHMYWDDKNLCKECKDDPAETILQGV
jgi:hypothetical protein